MALYVSTDLVHVQWLVRVCLRHVEWIAAMYSVLLDFLQSLLLRHHKKLLEHLVIFGTTRF